MTSKKKKVHVISSSESDDEVKVIQPTHKVTRKRVKTFSSTSESSDSDRPTQPVSIATTTTPKWKKYVAPKQTVPKKKESHYCRSCDKTFANPQNYYRHRKYSIVHGGPPPFKCCKCSKRYRTKVNLIEHSRKFHQLELASEEIQHKSALSTLSGDDEEETSENSSEISAESGDGPGGFFLTEAKEARSKKKPKKQELDQMGGGENIPSTSAEGLVQDPVSKQWYRGVPVDTPTTTSANLPGVANETGELPRWVISNQNNVTFITDPNNSQYKLMRQMSLFYCLAYEKCKDRKKSLPLAKKLLNECFPNLPNYRLFAGVLPSDETTLLMIERRLGIQINIFTSSQLGFNKRLMRSSPSISEDRDDIDLCFLNGYYIFLKDTSVFYDYPYPYMCNSCETEFAKACNLQRHKLTCAHRKAEQVLGKGKRIYGEVKKRIFAQGKFKPTPTIWERLRYCGVEIDSDNLKKLFTRNVIIIDSESFLHQPENLDLQIPFATQSQTILEVHRTCAISVCTNVEGVAEPTRVFLIEASGENPTGFIKKCVEYMLEVSELACAQYHKQLASVYDQLHTFEKSAYAKKDFNFLNILQSTKKRLDEYTQKTVVTGINILGYDAVVLRSGLFFYYLQLLDGPIRLLKKANRYLIISSQRLRLLDISHFQGSRFLSLRDYLKAYPSPNQPISNDILDEAELVKHYFPFSLLRNKENIYQMGLPTYEDFVDSISGSNMLEMNHVKYQRLLKDGCSESVALKRMGDLDQPPLNGQQLFVKLTEIWQQKSITNLKELLIFYAAQDVKPLLKAVEVNMELFFELQIDMLMSYISLPSLALPFAFSFVLGHNQRGSGVYFQNLDEYSYEMLKKGLMGGPSLIFTRLMVKDKSILRPHEVKQSDKQQRCHQILGYDAQFVGPYVVRKVENGYEPEFLHKTSRALEWLEYLSLKFGVHIQHIGNAYLEQNVWVPTKVKKSDANDDDEKETDSGESDSEQETIPNAPSMKRYRVDGIFVEGKRANNLIPSISHRNKLYAEHKLTESETKKKKSILEYMYCGFNHGWCDQHESGKDLDEIISILGKTPRKLKEETFKRFDYLAENFNVRYTWSCWWETLRRSDPEVEQFVNHFSFGPQIRQRTMTENEMLQAIADQDVEGVCKVSATVPTEARNYFCRFPPIFKHGTIGARQLDDSPMKVYAEKRNMNIARQTKSKSGQKLLLSVFSGKSLVLSTDYIRWLMDHGVTFYDLSVVIQFQTSRCFEGFVNEMTDRRREADRTGNKLLENQTKILVNSAYGGCIKSIHKYSNTRLVNEKQLVRGMRYGGFDNAMPVGPLAHHAETKIVVDQRVLDEEKESPSGEGGLYEYTCAPRILKYKQPFQLGFQILSHVKIELLGFYYDFLSYYLRPECFEAISTDTDSLYFGLATETLRESVKPEKLVEFDKEWRKWLVNDDDEWTKRQPGLWKLEATGTRMVALSSKLYHLENEWLDQRKMAHKGIQRGPNEKLLNRRTFLDVLFEPNSTIRGYCNGSDEEPSVMSDMESDRDDASIGMVEIPPVLNRGMAQKYGCMVTYEMRKSALNSFYSKFKVRSCLIHVRPYLDEELSSDENREETVFSDAEIVSMSEHDPFD